MKENDIIKQYNNLVGKEVTRHELNQLLKLSKGRVSSIYTKIKAVLDRSEKDFFFIETLKKVPLRKRGVQSKKTNSLSGVMPNGSNKESQKVVGTSDGSLDPKVCSQANKLFIESCFDEAPTLAEPFDEGLGKKVSQSDIYNFFTEKIIQLIDKNDGLTWSKPFQAKKRKVTGKRFLKSINFLTKNPYSGVNWVLLLAQYAERNEIDFMDGFNNPYFLTFKQIEKLKGRIKSGSKGYKIIYYNFIYSLKTEKNISFKGGDLNKFIAFVKSNMKTLKKDDQQIIANFGIDYFVRKKRIPFIQYYNVFNADDIQNIDFGIDPNIQGEILPTETKNIEKFQISEAIIKSYPKPSPLLKFHRQDKAFYRHGSGVDEVVMPEIDLFDDQETYYSTYFHELIHSTGNPKRLNRNMKGRFGSQPYAFEELVAELGALFLSGEAGLVGVHIKNSAAYIKGWNKRVKKTLKEDNKAIFKASALAQNAADFILDRNSDGVPKYLNFLASNTKNKAKKRKKLHPIKSKSKTVPDSEKKKTKTPKTPSIINRKKKVTSNTVKSKPKEKAAKSGQLTLALAAPSLADTYYNSKQYEFYSIDGDIGRLIGNIEVKPVESVAITLDAPAGSGKTRFTFQMINEVSKNYKVLFNSLEEHPESALFRSKIDEYIDKDNFKNISIIAESDKEKFKELIKNYDFVFTDSFGKLHGKPHLDNDFRKAFDGKVFFFIFQRTKDKSMKGSSDSEFDGDIILKLDLGENFTENVIRNNKNRYVEDLSLRYNIYKQQIVTGEETELVEEHKTPIALDFDFEIVE